MKATLSAAPGTPTDNYRDPAGWKPIPADAADMASLFPHFQKAAGEAMACRPGAEDDAVPFRYGAQDVRLRSFRDARGRQLVAATLAPERGSCGTPQEVAWMTHTFLMDGTPRHVGQELALVDAGDYDGDGSSELLFWHSGYNSDGYTLFDDTLRKRVDVGWSYH